MGAVLFDLLFQTGLKPCTMKVCHVNENGCFVCVCPVCSFQSSWRCQLGFCESLVNEQCSVLCLSKLPPRGVFIAGHFLIEASAGSYLISFKNG